MCGRYAATAQPDELIEYYGIDEVTDDGADACQPRWNIAPTMEVPAVVERASGTKNVRKLVSLRWGLVPSWSKDDSRGARLINARLETVAEKPSFRAAFRARRCILPAIGYYEWRQETVAGQLVKQPYFLHHDNQVLLNMAGIYEFWKGPDGWLATTSIITTRASDATGWLHDRMPTVVADVDAWLDPGLTDGETARALLETPAQLLVQPASRKLNRVENDGPGLIWQGQE